MASPVPYAALDERKSSYSPLKSAVDVYTVDTASPLVAIASCPLAPDGSHRLDANMIADPPSVRTIGRGLQEVTWNYTWQASGTNPLGGGESDPLKFPPILKWKIGISTEAKNSDENGRAIVNLAGQPFQQGLPFDVPSIFLTVERNEANFNLIKSLAFTGGINADDFMLLKRYAVTKGQCKCLGIEPGQYSLKARFVSMGYNFEIREDGFDARVLNQGKVGWFKNPTTGKTESGQFYTKDLSPVGEDVLLDRVGVPLEPCYRYCTKNLYPAVGCPRPPKLDKDQIEFASDGSIWLRYRMGKKRLNFGGLL